MNQAPAFILENCSRPKKLSVSVGQAYMKTYDIGLRGEDPQGRPLRYRYRADSVLHVRVTDQDPRVESSKISCDDASQTTVTNDSNRFAEKFAAFEPIAIPVALFRHRATAEGTRLRRASINPTVCSAVALMSFKNSVSPCRRQNLNVPALGFIQVDVVQSGCGSNDDLQSGSGGQNLGVDAMTQPDP